MKMTINKNGKNTLSGLTTTETEVILAIIDTANVRASTNPSRTGNGTAATFLYR